MVGQILLHYRITERLGAGGMGVVWKAIDTHLGREVALKVLRPDDTGNALRVRRFLREARSASALNHPNIITIYEASTADNIPFIAMEYVRGTALNELLRSTRLGMKQSLEIALQICAALQHAHEAGIVHRDLKPGNIMLTPAGTVKVLDFGLAKRTTKADAEQGDSIGPLTEEGTTIGTLAYMSPEQALGEEVGARSDLFSFGVVLYELLSQERPFDGSSMVGAMRRLLNSQPTSLRDIVPGIPGPLEAIVLRCLEKEPANRYASAAAVASELRQVLNAITQASSATTATIVAVPRRRRLPLGRIGIVFLTAMILIICGALGLRYFPRLARIRAPAAASAREIYATEYDAYRTARGFLDRYDKKGNIDRAVEALEAAVRLNPKYALAYAGLSEAYLRRNALKPDSEGERQMRDAADKAVKLNPDLAAAHVALGVALADSRENSDRLAAAGEFGKALELDPKSSSALLGLAKAAASSGDSTAAEADYRKAILLAPDEWLPLGEFGAFLYRAARYQEAAETWEKARKLTPDNVRVLTLLGSVYHMLDRYEDAASTFQRALEIEPSAQIYTNLGTARFFQGKYDDAVAAMQTALDLNGGSRALYWGNLGDAYRWAPGQRPKSLAAYENAIKLIRKEIKSAPNDSDLQASEAVYLAKFGDREGAVRQLNILAKLPKLTASARFNAAVAHEILGHRDSALRSLEAAIKLGYSSREVRNEPELAALRADPRFPPLLNRLEGVRSR
jgi:eukaryotic-like serine/threonine-protein kinase